MSQWEALAIILLIMALGDILSKVSKGKLPSALVIVLCFVIGYWTILPGDLITTSGISTGVYNICSYFLIANMATSIPLAEMKRQWKTIIVAVMAVAGICALGLTVGILIFGKLLVFSTISGFAGGSGALMVIQEVSQRIGAEEIVIMALICGNVQTLIGYPLTGVVLRREARRMEMLCDSGKLSLLEAAKENDYGWKPFVWFQQFSSPAVLLFKLGIVTLLSGWLSELTGGAISGLIFALILGFLGSLCGFLEPNILAKAKCDGFCFTFLLAYLFSLFSAVTPSLFVTYFVKILILAVIVTLGMAIAALICSKIFGGEFTFDMCMGICFTCYHGFPVNVALTKEAIEAVVSDEEKRAVISSHMLPKMLVGGFTSVTFVSVALANVIAPFLAALY
ncbi:hypothetical protein [Lachnoclostridium sp. An14]|uniref:hypothetical protein n=1 Tax=Lachnoclostridium sp. An14 TaxID=1965562 RepID=UPI00117A69F2|nr:hypothetical protein [Lachnoclostridium sp. An14]